tara:strand:- start:804 stop:1193 length:390 start_codon:yes stop_codon:yes gene_type:complete
MEVSKYLLLLFVFLAEIISEAKVKSKTKIILCDEARAQRVVVPYGRVTALNFPASPKEVIPGESGFDFKTIRSDLVIKALRPGAKTNLLVYLEGRRCSFHLATGNGAGDEIILIRDSGDKTFEVKFNDK